MSATYLDLTKLAADLQYASDNIEGATQDLLQNTANAMAQDMRAGAPKKTGYLANSISVKSGPLWVSIGPEAYYGGYVEDGTQGPYVIKPLIANVLAFQVNGQTVFAKKVVHPGNKPHPYVRPAAIRYLDSIGDDVLKIGIQLIGGQQ